MSAPTPTPGASPSAPSVPVGPDGTPDYGSVPVGSGGSVPVDDTGALDVWSLPQWIYDYEQQDKKPFFWDAPTVTTTEQSSDGEPALKTGKEPVNTSAEDLMKQFAAMAYNDPTGFAQMQTALAQGPWGSTGMKVTGSFDTATEKALADAMGQYLKTSKAAGVPVSFKDFILRSAQNYQALNPANGSGGSTSSRPELTDPDTLSMYAQKAAQAALGRNLSSTEINSFISSFHNEQTQAFNTATSGNGPVTDKNDPRASAIQFVTGQHQQEYAQQQIKGYADAFLNLFLKSGDQGAPNINVDPSAVSY